VEDGAPNGGKNQPTHGVVTKIATGQRTKNKICKNRVWSRHHSLFWKTKEKIKKDKIRSPKNHILGPGVDYASGRF